MLEWKTDDEGETAGDELLYVDGVEAGRVCPHHEGFVRLACVELDADFDTMEQAKEALEALVHGREPATKGRPFKTPDDPMWLFADIMCQLIGMPKVKES